MSIRIIRTSVLFATLAFVSFACNPKLPPVMKAVPDGTDVIGSIDAKASLGYIKKTLPKIVPAELKDKIPNVTELAKQAMTIAGVDIEKLTVIHFFGDISANTWTVVAQGLSAQGLKGKVSGKYKGSDIYSAFGGPVYTELKGLGLALAANDTLLKKVIDTFNGDSKRLADTEKGKMLKNMLKVHKDMDLVRLYVLTGKLPKMPMGMSMKIDGGGLFVDLDKGAAITVLTDKAGSDKIAQVVGMGLMAAQAGLMMGGSKDIPVKLDEEAKNVFTNFLGKVKTAKKESGVTISFQGDLKPIIEKVLTIGAEAYAKRPIPMPAVEPVSSNKDQPKKAPAKDESKESPKNKDQSGTAK